MKRYVFIYILLISLSVFSESYLLDVPYQAQTEDMDCWAACIAMTVNYYQNNEAVDWINVGDIIAEGPPNWQSDGITFEDFVSIFKKHNIETMTSAATPTKENIITDLSEKKPRLLVNTVYPTIWKHTTVCTGYDDFLDEFYWNDPGSGQRWGTYELLLTNKGVNDENAGSVEMLNPPVGDGDDDPADCYASMSKRLFNNPVAVKR
jgi:hypothetical protein